MGGEWLAGLGEGIKNAVSTYRDVRRDNDENAQREEDRKLRTQALAFDLAEKGYEVDPLHGKVVRTAGALERDEEDRALKTYQRGIELYRALGEGGQASPSGQGLLTSLNTQFRRLSVPRSQRQQVTDSPASPGARPQGLIPAGSVEGAQGLVPAGLVQDEAPNFNPPSGFKTKEERKEDAKIRAEERAEARRRARENKKDDTPQGRFQKMGTEGKQKLGFITGALQNLTDYDKIFQSGGRQAYITPNTPIIGNFKSSTPIDDARIQLEEAIGRLASGGAINTSEEARFRTMIPTAADKDEEAIRKLSLLRREFENKLTGYGFQVKDLPALGFDLESRGYGPKNNLSPEDVEALNWAKQNPNDKRSKAIRERLGQ